MRAVDGIREAARLFASRLGVDHALVSPIRADLRGSPPMPVHAGTDDTLPQDAVAFVSKAREARCDVYLQFELSLIHPWPQLLLPEAQQDRRLIGSFLRC